MGEQALVPEPAEAPQGRRYEPDFNRRLADAGGMTAFAAIDRGGAGANLMAVEVRPWQPPRASALQALMGATEKGTLWPLALGTARRPDGTIGQFVYSRAPTGRSLATALAAEFTPWGEAELIADALRPLAAVLEALQARGLTHRAIRPDNVFSTGRGGPVTLGGAWAAPPAIHQPTAFEPPYSGICLPAGRGDGRIADDVYALGVLLVVLATGRLPMEGMDAAAIVRRKLDLGCFDALVGRERLPGGIADLVRGMTAEDPEHRLTPRMLADPHAARARRVAARPERRAQAPIDLSGTLSGNAAWTARALAGAIAAEPEQGARALRLGVVDRWLRRGLGDTILAGRADEAVRVRAAEGPADDSRADHVLAARAVAILDPLAPLCWRRIALWPDGLGPALAAHGSPNLAGDRVGELADTLHDLVADEVMASWAQARAGGTDPSRIRNETRRHRDLLIGRRPNLGTERLRYALNPLLVCSSATLAGKWVAQASDLLAALEQVAASPDRPAAGPLDREVIAFLAARTDQRVDAELALIEDRTKPAEAAIAQLRLLARLQPRTHSEPLPRLAAWLADLAAPAVEMWRSRSARQAIERQLRAMSATGRLPAVLAVLDDEPLAADREGAERAEATVANLDRQIAALRAGEAGRRVLAERIGHEVAAGVGFAAITLAIVAAVVG